MKAVRLKKVKDDIAVVGADIFPPANMGNGDSGLNLPKRLRAKNAALAVSGENSVVRLLNLPDRGDRNKTSDAVIREHLGLEEDYRLALTVSNTARGKAETRMLAVGVPEAEAQACMSVLASGSPATVFWAISGPA